MCEKKLPKDIIKLLKEWENKFPKNKKRSVIIAGLHILQDHNNGYLTIELMNLLAKYLSLPSAYIYEAANFYSMYNLNPVGKYQINLCTNISCMLKGAKNILSYIENKLSIKNGETTKDGLITLKSVECQGVCCAAPIIEINKKLYEKITIDKINKLITSLE